MDAHVTGAGTNLKIKGDIGAGGNIYLDYLLPIGIPLSLGAEFGVDSSSFQDGGYTDNILAIPLLLRAAYHFDLHPQLDLYLVGKVGYVIGAWSGDNRDGLESMGVTIDPDPPAGMGFGADLGIAYYFTPVFGLFAEGGFDGYMLQTKLKVPGAGTATLDAPFYRFVTVGISTKF